MEKHSLGDLLNSSFLYYLYLLYSKKWGNQGDDIMEYICLDKASKGDLNQPGTGTIILYFRKIINFFNIDSKIFEFLLYKLN